MNVDLYVYDLSRGLARALSQQYLGIHLDAVYHTSVVFNKTEYFFGAGIQTCRPPGSTHHGQPMKSVRLGTTHLPSDTIDEYLDALREVYSAERYDLFEHNCNNFSHDLSTFLVGQGIPDEITSLPRRVLETPLGQMLRPQLDQSMRGITQTPMTNPSSTVRDNFRDRPSLNATAAEKPPRYGNVVEVTDSKIFDKHLAAATDTAATVFFTSATCHPCRLAYPMYDALAAENPDCLFVKTDIAHAHDLAVRYNIRATPTFHTYSRGTYRDEWTGADPPLLRANVNSLIRHAFPPHPHTLLGVPTLQFGSLKPMTFAKTPPLYKITRTLGPAAAEWPAMSALCFFIAARASPSSPLLPAPPPPLPDLSTIAEAFTTQVPTLPLSTRFAAVDLLRGALLDPRLAAFFASEPAQTTLPSLLNANPAWPHSLRLVTLHLASNLTATPHFLTRLAPPTASLLIRLTTSALLDPGDPTACAAAATLAFNLATATYRFRREQAGQEALEQDLQLELVASVIEALGAIASAIADARTKSRPHTTASAAGEGPSPVHDAAADETTAATLLSALGYLVYCAPMDGEVADLTRAMDAREVVAGVRECRVAVEVAGEVVELLEALSRGEQAA